MIRLGTLGTQCLFVGALFFAVSAAPAKTLTHPYCTGSGGKQAAHCTTLHATYTYGQGSKRTIKKVRAVISENCSFQTSTGGWTTIFAAEDAALVLPEKKAFTSPRQTPMSVDFVFPSGCAVKLHGRIPVTFGNDVVRWFSIFPKQNIGTKSSFTLDLATGDWNRTEVIR